MVNQNLLKIVEKIISLDPQMRFASIIDLKGNIVEGIMKTGKNSLESQRQEEHFCEQVSQRRKMRKEFDRPLGKVSGTISDFAKEGELVWSSGYSGNADGIFFKNFLPGEPNNMNNQEDEV